ncbi:hypothetical protein HMPREF3159_03550 [Brachybacterium sp. HMSC06H03]|uniref:hypothetical protein n=1 Tax=Brachybacterium sp. HMSC06H03 TaxID=1581127 RepID=UPI0008A1302C|nr:hypothetical protein [Brachybacterium sp. HMSC06H03]OFT62600.1 hypothetical protein HMPREF3159_03550 [Brachybacterium sp. HMSC06H03]
MTTDTTVLQERIARAIHRSDKDEMDRPADDFGDLAPLWQRMYLHNAAAVLPIIAAEVQAAVEARESRQVQVRFDPPPPQMVPVRLPCPRCGHR